MPETCKFDTVQRIHRRLLEYYQLKIFRINTHIQYVLYIQRKKFKLSKTLAFRLFENNLSKICYEINLS